MGICSQAQHWLLAFALMVAAGCSKAGENLAFEQIGTGFNGPTKTEIRYFETRSAVTESWIGGALTPSELDQVFSKIDFGRQMLVSFGTGQYSKNTTGTIVVERVVQYEKTSVVVYVRIGVNMECGAKGPTEPYALVVMERMAMANVGLGWDALNVPEECFGNQRSRGRSVSQH
jgi:hypothetical protein